MAYHFPQQSGICRPKVLAYLLSNEYTDPDWLGNRMMSMDAKIADEPESRPLPGLHELIFHHYRNLSLLPHMAQYMASSYVMRIAMASARVDADFTPILPGCESLGPEPSIREIADGYFSRQHVTDPSGQLRDSYLASLPELLAREPIVATRRFVNGGYDPRRWAERLPVRPVLVSFG